ncbi:MAG: phosphoribosyl-ATP diphosphatase [Alphaproteobacteria bacterium]|nr:phosphoribosyl-ATP diphosphatase [Alphaproteobacteria bacterium]
MPGDEASSQRDCGPETAAVLDRLYAAIQTRRTASPEDSYTARLFAKGRRKIAQKLGEEAVEAVIETVEDRKTGLVGESADLLYHLLVCWAAVGVKPDDVWAELAHREGVSGIAERLSRKAGPGH